MNKSITKILLLGFKSITVLFAFSELDVKLQIDSSLMKRAESHGSVSVYPKADAFW
jgi:hypothetical protein